MDIDAFIAVRGQDWERLRQLLRVRRPDAGEIDELVALYQRTATDLSLVRSRNPDPALQARLSMLVHRTRLRITGARTGLWAHVRAFLWDDLPAALYRSGHMFLACAALFLLVSIVSGVAVAHSDALRGLLLSEEEQRMLVERDFVEYYFAGTASGFAARVWTNNAWIAVQAVVLGVTGFWPVMMILQNAVSVGAIGGVLAAHDALDVFFVYITPHGLLEITAVLIGSGAGLRVFWAWIRPGALPRMWALATAARSMMTVAVGLVGVLFVSGLLEAFVTPSPLPAAVRIGIGVLAWLALLVFIVVRGRRAAAQGITGDLSEELVGDRIDVAA